MQISITLDVYNILIGFIILGAIFTTHIMENNEPILKKVRQWFNKIALINILMSAVDILTVVFEGSGRPINYTILPIATFVLYFLGFLFLPASGICILHLLDRYSPLTKARRFPYVVILFCSIVYYILLATTPFTHLLYTIDENNIASRGSYFFIAIILQVIMYISLAIYMLLNRKDIVRLKVSIILSFIFFPQVAQILQLALPGVTLVNTGFSLIFIIMFVFSNNIAENQLKNAESEIDEKQNELLEKTAEIEKKGLQIIKMQTHTIESLSNLVENRDEDTGEHVRRTKAYVELLATQMMKNNLYPEVLTPRYIVFLKRAAPMHDIGKIVVSDAILKKPSRLTPEEFSEMKRHAAEGGRIVHDILDGYEKPDYIQITADIATHHHEKWDGTGYPDNLKETDIPLSARIMALADVFDALVSPRVYKDPMSYDEAFQIIEENSGTHFDPVIVEEFLKIKEKVAAVNESFKVI